MDWPERLAMEWLILLIVLAIAAWIVQGELRRRQAGQRGRRPQSALRHRRSLSARPSSPRTRVFTPTRPTEPVAKPPTPAPGKRGSPTPGAVLRAARVIDDPSRPCWVSGSPRTACTCAHCEADR